MKAMLLAAGRGQRMRPLTNVTPKPLLKIGQHALIEYHLYALANAGFQEIIINVSYYPEQFVALLNDGKRYGVQIHYSFEPPESFGLEVGGGIFNALPLLGNEPFVAISADLWTDYPFAKLPKQIPGLAHLVLVNNPLHHPEGDFCLSNGSVFTAEKDKLNFAGIAVYHPKLFANCSAGKFPIAPLLRAAMAQKLITGEYFPGAWINLGTVQQLEELQQAHANKTIKNSETS